MYLFERVMNCGDPDLSLAARFNLAHVYAKRDNKSDLNNALSLLLEVPRNPPAPEKVMLAKRAWEQIRGKAAGRNAVRARNYQETTALAFQALTLRCAVEARIALKGKDQPGFKKAVGELERIRSTIIAANNLIPEHKHDLLADSWTKSGFLAYLDANTSQIQRADRLEDAEESLKTALQYKPFWIPAQTYLAMVHKAQANAQAASTALVPVLGKLAAGAPPSADEVVAYITAMPLGTPAGTIASLVLRAFGPLVSSTLQLVVRGLDHTKLTMEVIDEITKAMEQPAQS